MKANSLARLERQNQKDEAREQSRLREMESRYDHMQQRNLDLMERLNQANDTIFDLKRSRSSLSSGNGRRSLPNATWRARIPHSALWRAAVSCLSYLIMASTSDRGTEGMDTLLIGFLILFRMSPLVGKAESAAMK